MKRTYLIDSENINDIWVEILNSLEEKDEILVFYTDKSAHMGYDRIIRLMELKRGTVRWIRCFEGQNALDFQLVTELGSRISQEPKREYIIVSNDTGYDAVVRYWQQKEYRVRRMKGVECETLVGAEPETDRKDDAKKSSVPNDTAEKRGEEKDTAENDSKESAARAEALKDESTTKAAEKHAVETALDEAPEKDDLHDSQADHQEFQEWQNDHAAVKGQKAVGISSETTSSDTAAAAKSDSWRDELTHVFRETGSHNPQADMAFLQELCKTVKLSNMSLMHNVLEYHFGQTAGNAIYHFIKENPGCRGELSAGYSNNKKQRERQYLSLILRRNHIVPEEGDEEAILKILGGIPRKNLNSIHTALVKKFGQEEGGNCYAVLRNHVKIIRGL